MEEKKRFEELMNKFNSESEIKNDNRLNSIRQYSTNVKIGEKPVLILHKQKDN